MSPKVIKVEKLQTWMGTTYRFYVPQKKKGYQPCDRRPSCCQFSSPTQRKRLHLPASRTYERDVWRFCSRRHH